MNALSFMTDSKGSFDYMYCIIYTNKQCNFQCLKLLEWQQILSTLWVGMTRDHDCLYPLLKKWVEVYAKFHKYRQTLRIIISVLPWLCQPHCLQQPWHYMCTSFSSSFLINCSWYVLHAYSEAGENVL